MNDTRLPERLEPHINAELFAFVESALTHYGTDDLVVFLDLSGNGDELVATPRERASEAPGLSTKVRAKLSKPAAAVAEGLVAPRLSFWLFVEYDDDSADCLAVNSSMLAPGGTA